MNILLTALNSKYVHSNLALKYLKASLEKGCPDCNAVIKEFTINDVFSNILAEIYTTEADVYAFSCYIWNIEYILELCANLKLVKPETVIILGGPEVSYCSEEVLENNTAVDFIICGEGEKSLSELIMTLKNKCSNYDSIDGLCFRSINDNKIKSTGFCIIEDLSEIPSPFTGDLSCYNKKVAYYESSRGCPYNCTYCLSSTIKGIRCFPMGRVKNELKKIIDSNAMQVKFVDRTFNTSKQRALEIWKYISENNKNTVFHFEIGAHLLDDEMLDFLKQIPEGMFEFEIGIQSTNKNTINEVCRKTDFEAIKRNVEKLMEYDNIHIHLDLIAGLPYEDYNSFKKSFNDVYSLKPHMLQLGFLKMLKGSKIREEREIHEYKFTLRPPYEILSNKYISYDEIIKLKKIEEMVEIYKNSGRYENTLKFISMNHSSPFDFFESLSEYWYSRNTQKRKISQEESYDILFEYFNNNYKNAIETLRELLKLDFIINNFGARNRFWEYRYVFNDMKAETRNMLNNMEFISEYCAELKDMQASDRIKRVHFEIIKMSGDKYSLMIIKRQNENGAIIKSSCRAIDEKYFKAKEIIRQNN